MKGKASKKDNADGECDTKGTPKLQDFYKFLTGHKEKRKTPGKASRVQSTSTTPQSERSFYGRISNLLHPGSCMLCMGIMLGAGFSSANF